MTNVANPTLVEPPAPATALDKPVNRRAMNRRGSIRKRARKSIRLQCRRGATGLGANVASGYLDISESGAQLVINDSVKPGDELEVILESYGMRGALRRLSDVRWAIPVDGGGWRIGVRFQKRLTFREVQNLSMP